MTKYQLLTVEDVTQISEFCGVIQLWAEWPASRSCHTNPLKIYSITTPEFGNVN
jgi:hypothetical protein